MGCFEVGRKKDMEAKFESLVEEEGTAYGPDDMVVAYPSETMLDVGLSQETWPLVTQQYADIEVDLVFPENSTDAVSTAHGDSLESDSALAESTTVADIERSILESINIQEFSDVKLEVDGVAMSTVEEHQKHSEESSPEVLTRHLRSSRKVQASEEPSALNSYTVVKYKFTARGQYNPPPRLQLGQIAEDSINVDSRRLTKTLQEKIDVFSELQTVNSKHVTIKGYGDSVAADPASDEIRPPPLGTLNAQNAESRNGLAPWATVPIILLAILMSGLIGLFFFRRAFHRRRVVHNDQDLKKGETKEKQFDSEYDRADEEAAAKGKVDAMDCLMVDKAEVVPANMASSGTSGSSGVSEDRHADSSERRRRKKSRKSKAREIASSLRRSLTLTKEDDDLSDISDHAERRRKRKKAKEEARRLASDQGADDEATSERRRSRRTPRRRSSDILRDSLKAAGDAVERRRKKRSGGSSKSKSSRHSSRRVDDEV